MASVKKIPIYGEKTIEYDKKAIDSIKKNNLSSRNISLRSKQYTYPKDKDETLAKRWRNNSFNFTDYVSQRELGISKRVQSSGVCRDELMKRVLSSGQLKEHMISLNDMNKVFCSTWLNERQILFGTKCKKIVIYDLQKKSFDYIPVLGKDLRTMDPAITQQGIYSLKLNPSQTLLASQTNDSRNISVYKLPTFDPYCQGVNGHNEIIYDLLWLDDTILVSGSKDGSIAAWRIEDDLQGCPNIIPFYVKNNSEDSIRGLAYNERLGEFVSLSIDGKVACWDVHTLTQNRCNRVQFENGQSCIAVHEGLIAVGAHQGTHLMEDRNLTSIAKVSRDKNSVRSVSFQGNILTTGNADGFIEMFDVRSKRISFKSIDTSLCFLRTSKGYKAPRPQEDERFQGVYSDLIFDRLFPSIYTHCYDSSGTRLFAAGGPLSIALDGHYAAIWQ